MASGGMCCSCWLTCPYTPLPSARLAIVITLSKGVSRIAHRSCCMYSRDDENAIAPIVPSADFAALGGVPSR